MLWNACDYLTKQQTWLTRNRLYTCSYATLGIMQSSVICQYAQMVTSGWWMGQSHQWGKAEWRSATTIPLAPFVMITGILLMLVWCAETWDSMNQKVMHALYNRPIFVMSVAAYNSCLMVEIKVHPFCRFCSTWWRIFWKWEWWYFRGQCGMQRKWVILTRVYI